MPGAVSPREELTMSNSMRSWTKWLRLLQGEIGKFQTEHFALGTWTPDQYLIGMVTEVGEVADVRKRLYRGQLSDAQATEELAPELADVFIYTILMAWRSGIDLGAAFDAKMTEIHRRVHETEHYGPAARKMGND